MDITLAVEQQITVFVLEGGEVCQVSGNAEPGSPEPKTVVMPTREAALAEIRRRLGLAAPDAKPEALERTRESCTDEEAWNAAMKAAGDEPVNLGHLKAVPGVGLKRAARLLKKYNPGA